MRSKDSEGTSARPARARRRPPASPSPATPSRLPEPPPDASRPRRWRSIWISDLHLGTRACRAERLLEFLATHDSEYLYLVGDVVDGWSLRRAWYWNDEHNRVLQAILAKSSRGTRVSYVTGNHDEFLREFGGLMLGGIAVKSEAEHRTADGLELLVLHGDAFDACIRNARWLAALGDHAYLFCKALNPVLDRARRLLGMRPWSLADALRRRVKDALSYVESFERAVALETRRRGFDGVVCGHIHQAAIRELEGVLYCNDGDWVESCTALVEDFSGRLSILRLAPTGAPKAAVAGRAR